MKTKDVIWSEDTWDLCVTQDQSPSWQMSHFLHHVCLDTTGLVATRYRYRGLHHPCGWCHKAVPEGIQAMFVLMTGDMKP
ncbi:hypothetical protein LCGC14_0209530 [marine sediment metagenome]|uniref:Uncharacterized protein n=1 Tax=marine sediment metagenome TaxID=412755 RepID=A0A0F9UY73_9ZZZZ